MFLFLSLKVDKVLEWMKKYQRLVTEHFGIHNGFQHALNQVQIVVCLFKFGNSRRNFKVLASERVVIATLKGTAVHYKVFSFTTVSSKSWQSHSLHNVKR